METFIVQARTGGKHFNLSSLGVPGVPWHTQILADQLTLFQPGEADYAHQIIMAPPDFQTFLRPCCKKMFGLQPCN